VPRATKRFLLDPTESGKQNRASKTARRRNNKGGGKSANKHNQVVGNNEDGNRPLSYSCTAGRGAMLGLIVVPDLIDRHVCKVLRAQKYN
jgi:hypothetical protein